MYHQQQQGPLNAEACTFDSSPFVAYPGGASLSGVDVKAQQAQEKRQKESQKQGRFGGGGSPFGAATFGGNSPSFGQGGGGFGPIGFCQQDQYFRSGQHENMVKEPTLFVPSHLSAFAQQQQQQQLQQQPLQQQQQQQQLQAYGGFQQSSFGGQQSSFGGRQSFAGASQQPQYGVSILQPSPQQLAAPGFSQQQQQPQQQRAFQQLSSAPMPVQYGQSSFVPHQQLQAQPQQYQSYGAPTGSFISAPQAQNFGPQACSPAPQFGIQQASAGYQAQSYAPFGY